MQLSPSVVCLVSTNAAELCGHISELNLKYLAACSDYDVTSGSCLLGVGVSEEPNASSELFSSHTETT